ncbi:hypothetical protein [Aliiglaciecola litoralis]|uniref:High-affinity iron transporter n=1 Tax=Aliiglaciecola litoralis TaxID=582857 RepID=A0ABN1LEV7_9ALTE
MLTNTVVFFLRDALPIFWSIALLSLLVADKRKWMISGGIAGSILCVILSLSIPKVSAMLDGSGYELLHIALMLVNYVIFSWLYCAHENFDNGNDLWIAAALALACMIALNATNGMMFFASFWQPAGANQVLLLGALLGLGICASVAMLLVLLLDPIEQKAFARILLLLFAAGQVSQVANLLQQIDWFSSEQLWSTRQWVSDENELGQFLATLFGYNSSPTIALTLFFIIALVTPLLVRRTCSARLQNNLEQNHETD